MTPNLLKYTLVPTLMLLLTQAPAQTWTLIWADEFNGTTLDGSSWNVEVNNYGGWNNELQYYTDRPENVRVESGNLVIEGRSENYLNRNYTSARLNSNGKRSWQYGKIEARMKLPYGNGMWPAFWMMGNTGSWPANGEIDIMEMVGGNGCNDCADNLTYGNHHWQGTNGLQSAGTVSPALVPGIYHDAFHVFSIEWDAVQINWFIDGLQFYSSNITATSKSEFHQPFYILLNLAIGGNWPGSPDASTVFPQQLLVDYVRVYQFTTTIKEQQEELFFTTYDPVSGTVHIHTTVQSASSSVELYNLNGQLLLKKQIEGGTTPINSAVLVKGIYVLKMYSENGVSVKKILIE